MQTCCCTKTVAAFERSLQTRLATKGLIFRSIPSTKANGEELIGCKGPSTFTINILEDAFEMKLHNQSTLLNLAYLSLFLTNFQAINHWKKRKIPRTGEKREIKISLHRDTKVLQSFLTFPSFFPTILRDIASIERVVLGCLVQFSFRSRKTSISFVPPSALETSISTVSSILDER